MREGVKVSSVKVSSIRVSRLIPFKSQVVSLVDYIVFIAFFAALFIGLPNVAYAYKLPDTGQTKCYNESGAEISCAGTGQDGEYSITSIQRAIRPMAMGQLRIITQA